MHWDVIAPEREVYPLEEGPIEPTGKVEAMRLIASQAQDYPHCPLCHRALLATETDFVCPNQHYTVPQPKPIGWWHTFLSRILRTAEV